MRCPSCHQNIRVQGKFCPKCGDQIFGLPVRGPGEAPPPVAAGIPAPPPPPTAYAPAPPPPNAMVLDDDFAPSPYRSAQPSDPLLDITLEDSSPGPATPAEAVGETCPYCRFPIKPGEPVQICPSCSVAHHRDCWQENGGCTVYGCRSSPAMAGTAAPLTAPTQTVPSWPPYSGGGYGGYQPTALPREAIALLEAELTRLATNAFVFALLGFIPFVGALLALIGLLTGISVLGQISHSGLPARRARSLAWAAVIISVCWLIVVVGLVAAVAQGGGG